MFKSSAVLAVCLISCALSVTAEARTPVQVVYDASQNDLSKGQAIDLINALKNAGIQPSFHQLGKDAVVYTARNVRCKGTSNLMTSHYRCSIATPASTLYFDGAAAAIVIGGLRQQGVGQGPVGPDHTDASVTATSISCSTWGIAGQELVCTVQSVK